MTIIRQNTMIMNLFVQYYFEFQYIAMNNTKTQDPFRFLTRIKKNTTPLKQASNKAPPSLAQMPVSSITSISNAQSINQSIDQSTVSKIFRGDCSKRPPYDPDRYYNQKLQDYLKQINFKQNPQYKQHELFTSDNVMGKQQINGKKLEKVFPSESQLKVSYEQQLKTDTKNNSQRNKLYKQSLNQITFKKIDFEHVEGHIGNFNRDNNLDLQFFEEDEMLEGEGEGQVQLRQCGTCGRKFNWKSYDKHVKVCQKVFMKKRKPFSSEKQRSLSKDKKK